MLDASNFDPRALRIRIVEALSYPMWISVTDLAKRLDTPVYTVGAMVSKLYLYGGPIERQPDPHRGNKFLYRLKPSKKT